MLLLHVPWQHINARENKRGSSDKMQHVCMFAPAICFRRMCMFVLLKTLSSLIWKVAEYFTRLSRWRDNGFIS